MQDAETVNRRQTEDPAGPLQGLDVGMNEVVNEQNGQYLRSRLTVEEQHELGVLVRAIEDLCAAVAMPKEFGVLFRSLFKATIETALERAKPDRRMSYLEQWRDLLCWLPQAITGCPENQRVDILTKTIEHFQLRSMKGKRKSTPFPSGDIRLRTRDGEPWFVRLHDDDRIEYLRPINQPRVLKVEVRRALIKLPSWRSTDLMNDERKRELFDQIKAMAPDIPVEKVDLWLTNRHSRSESHT